MATVKGEIDRATKYWEGRDQRQKRLLLAGAAVAAILLAVFGRMIASPDYQTLSSGLESSELQKLSSQLDAQGIPHETGPDGKSLAVPAAKLDAARMAIASLGASGGQRAGFELFDKMSWGQTEFDQKVTYQRALEGELERSIETLSDVASARVHLVMATDSVFADSKRPAKASVILKLRGNGISKEAVMSISRLVSGAVDSLQPEDVSIVDADTARSLGLGHNAQTDGEGLEVTLAQRLINTLEPVVGIDKIRATVHIDQDQSSSEESQEKYDPTVSALLTDQKTQEQQGAVQATTGVPGTTSNIPPTDKKTATPPTTPTTQLNTSDNATYGVNRTMTRTRTPAGRIQRVSAAILVDDAVVKTMQGKKEVLTHRKRTQDELNRIQQLAQAVIGFDARRGDSISVQDMPFDTTAAEAELTPPSWMQQQGKNLSAYSSLLRPVSLLALFVLAYLFVIRPIQKQALAPSKGGPPGPTQAALPPAPAREQFGLSGSGGELRAGAQAGSRLGSLGGDFAGGSGGSQPVIQTVSQRGNQRASQLKDQTIELVKQKPANTARALQAWLREEPS